MKVLILTLAMFLSSQLFAKTHKLLKIRNTVTNEYMDMNLEENDLGDITSLEQVHKDGKKPKKVYSIQSIKKGVVLLKTKGRDIVTLNGKNLDTTRGGEITIGFLVNAVTKNSKSKRFKIQQESDGSWSMYFQGRRVSLLEFIGNKVRFIGLVGVKEIVIRFANSKIVYNEKFSEEEGDQVDRATYVGADSDADNDKL